MNLHLLELKLVRHALKDFKYKKRLFSMSCVVLFIEAWKSHTNAAKTKMSQQLTKTVMNSINKFKKSLHSATLLAATSPILLKKSRELQAVKSTQESMTRKKHMSLHGPNK